MINVLIGLGVVLVACVVVMFAAIALDIVLTVWDEHKR